MPFLESSDQRFYYRHWSTPNPRAGVVLLHGRGEHSGLYHRFAADLNHQDVEVWGIDHLAHGHTGGDPDGCADFDGLAANAGTLLRTVAAERPGLPLVLVGHSLGGLTAAVLYQRQRPDIHALVLSGTPLERKVGHRARLAAAGEPVMSKDPAYLDALAVDPLLAAAGEPDAEKFDKAIITVLEELSAGIAEWTVPILFLNGEHDVVARPEVAARWADGLPGARYVELPGGHHDVLNDVCHREAAEIVAGFVLDHAT